MKLSALHSFRELARSIGADYTWPENGKLGEIVYFDKDQADVPLSSKDLNNQKAIDLKTGKVLSQESTDR